MPNSLKFTPGRRYRTRCGWVMELESVNKDNPEYQWLLCRLVEYSSGALPDHVIKQTYTPEGNISTYRYDGLDLVELIDV